MTRISSSSISRRNFITGAVGAGAAVASRHCFGFAPRFHDDAMLDDLSRRCFQFFVDAVDRETGICRDLINGNNADNERKGDEARGSAGVTGFCLAALCIGAERKWMPRGSKGYRSPHPSQLHQRHSFRGAWLVLSLQQRPYRGALERG